MLKLVLCLVSAILLGVLLLQLRQQRLELNVQCNRLHNQIRARQGKLWNQQLQIAVFTAPNAISQTVNERDLKMVPDAPLPAQKANWLRGHDPDAE